jgi:hypothetical protein
MGAIGGGWLSRDMSNIPMAQLGGLVRQSLWEYVAFSTYDYAKVASHALPGRS